MERAADGVERIIAPQRFPLDVAPYDATAKTIALRDAAVAVAKGRPGRITWELPHLAVTFANRGAQPVPGEPIIGGPNLHGRTRTTCRLCAECDIGCNYGSKSHDGSPGVVLAGWPMFGPAGFAKMDREFFREGKPARVVCPRDPGKVTPLCAKAETLATCTPQGTQFVACEVPAASRPLVLQP